MAEIGRDELYESLQREGNTVVLAMIAGESEFTKAHIPTSINVAGLRQGLSLTSGADDVVIYGCSSGCQATKAAYRMLSAFGSPKLYAGGLADWKDAGLPLEGSDVAPNE